MYTFLVGLMVRRLEDSLDEMILMSVCIRRMQKR